MLKILTAQIKEEVYNLLISHELFPKEEKRHCQGIKGTGELRYTDKHIIEESKMRLKKFVMAWIAYRSAYDKVPYDWITYSFKLYKISGEHMKFIEK